MFVCLKIMKKQKLFINFHSEFIYFPENDNNFISIKFIGYTLHFLQKYNIVCRDIV